MKITATNSIEKPKTEEIYPYIASYPSWDIVLVLVTGPGRDERHKTGTMITPNKMHKPFAYIADTWESDGLIPFKGQITIDCNK